MGYGMSYGGSTVSSGGGAADDEFYQNKLKALITDPAAFQKTPGFQHALDTGKQAIERRFAANGMGNSGNVLAELMKYGTGLASQEYGSTLDRFAGLAGGERSASFAKKESDRGAMRDWMNYGLGRDRLAVDDFNARTNRGQAKSQDWWNWSKG